MGTRVFPLVLQDLGPPHEARNKAVIRRKMTVVIFFEFIGAERRCLNLTSVVQVYFAFFCSALKNKSGISPVVASV